MIGEVPQNHHGFALFDPQKMGTFQGMDTKPPPNGKFGKSSTQNAQFFWGGYVIVPWRVI